MATNNIVGDFEFVAATKRYIKRKSAIQVGLGIRNTIRDSVIRTKLNAASGAVKVCSFVCKANLSFSLREFSSSCWIFAKIKLCVIEGPGLQSFHPIINCSNLLKNIKMQEAIRYSPCIAEALATTESR
jgi:hypothetical protein